MLFNFKTRNALNTSLDCGVPVDIKSSEFLARTTLPKKRNWKPMQRTKGLLYRLWWKSKSLHASQRTKKMNKKILSQCKLAMCNDFIYLATFPSVGESNSWLLLDSKAVSTRASRVSRPVKLLVPISVRTHFLNLCHCSFLAGGCGECSLSDLIRKEPYGSHTSLPHSRYVVWNSSSFAEQYMWQESTAA